MPRIIKKYPNRRLYDTETSAYITLADVKQFVLETQNFEVQDARSGENLTRSILLQIILEEESGGVPMFSSDMLANIIRYYGHSMQGLMGSYLERSIGAFHEAQRKFQAQTQSLYGNMAGGATAAGLASKLGTAIPEAVAGLGANLSNLTNLTKAVPALNPETWSKMVQEGVTGVPNMMGDYLEKSASNVIGMQEELRKQAMQMFSTFPYNPAAGAENSVGAESTPKAAAKSASAAKAKAKSKKNSRG